MTSDHELVLEWRREHHGDEVTGSYTALVKLIAKVRAAAVREALEEAAREAFDFCSTRCADRIRALMPGEKP